MSFSMRSVGSDKNQVKAQLATQFEKQSNAGPELKAALFARLDATTVPMGPGMLDVQCQGHFESSGGSCTFSIQPIPTANLAQFSGVGG